MATGEEWMQDAPEVRSRRENDVAARGEGEMGWEYGWNPYDVMDQLAHLGEMLCEVALARRDPEGMAMYAEDYDGAGGAAQWLAEMDDRIARDSFELNLLVQGNVTRAVLLLTERLWDDHKKAGN